MKGNNSLKNDTNERNRMQHNPMYGVKPTNVNKAVSGV